MLKLVILLLLISSPFNVLSQKLAGFSSIKNKRSEDILREIESTLDIKEAAVICQYIVQKMNKLFDLAKECPDIIDFNHVPERQRKWVPDPNFFSKWKQLFDAKIKEDEKTKLGIKKDGDHVYYAVTADKKNCTEGNQSFIPQDEYKVTTFIAHQDKPEGLKKIAYLDDDIDTPFPHSLNITSRTKLPATNGIPLPANETNSKPTIISTKVLSNDISFSSEGARAGKVNESIVKRIEEEIEEGSGAEVLKAPEEKPNLDNNNSSFFSFMETSGKTEKVTMGAEKLADKTSKTLSKKAETGANRGSTALKSKLKVKTGKKADLAKSKSTQYKVTTGDSLNTFNNINSISNTNILTNVNNPKDPPKWGKGPYLTYIDIKHPVTKKYIDRNKGTIQTVTELGSVAKTTVLDPTNRESYRDIEHYLDPQFQKSDKITHYNVAPKPGEYPQTQNAKPQDLISSKNARLRRTAPGSGNGVYLYRTKVGINSPKQFVIKKVQTNSKTGVEVNKRYYGYGKTMNTYDFDAAYPGQITDYGDGAQPLYTFGKASSFLEEKEKVEAKRFEELKKGEAAMEASLNLEMENGSEIGRENMFSARERSRSRFPDAQWKCAERNLKEILNYLCKQEISLSFTKYCKVVFSQFNIFVESFLYHDHPLEVCQRINMCPSY